MPKKPCKYENLQKDNLILYGKARMNVVIALLAYWMNENSCEAL